MKKAEKGHLAGLKFWGQNKADLQNLDILWVFFNGRAVVDLKRCTNRHLKQKENTVLVEQNESREKVWLSLIIDFVILKQTLLKPKTNRKQYILDPTKRFRNR